MTSPKTAEQATAELSDLYFLGSQEYRERHARPARTQPGASPDGDDEPVQITDPVAYVAKALAGTVADLASTPDGGRNDALNRAAFALGRLQGGGLPLDVEDATERLYEACNVNGYNVAHRDTYAVIERALADGASRSPIVWTQTETVSKPAPLVGAGAGGGDVGVGSKAAVDHGWLPLDLTPYLDGTHRPKLPELLRRQDGAHLMYGGCVHWLSGEPETLKSWLALLATAQELLVGRRVVYIDLEDSASGVVERLRAMGVTDEILRTSFVYVSPTGALAYDEQQALRPVVEAASLVVIDAATEALAMERLDPNDAADVAQWLALLPRWAAALGPAVLVLDHVVKNKDARGRYATGSGHKLAGLDGVAFTIEAVQPAGRGMIGRSRVIVRKDRHGHVNPHTRRTKGADRWAGDLVVDAKSAPGYVDVVVFPPSEHEPEFLPTVLMGRVSDALAKAITPLSETAVVTRVTGNAGTVRQALAALVDEGFVVWETGAHNAKLHRLVKPYPPEDDA